MAESDAQNLSDEKASENPNIRTEVEANEFNRISIPEFWREEPKLWFSRLEKDFAAYHVRSNSSKVSTVLRHLDIATLKSVADILDTPVADSYDQLKNVLIARHVASEETQLKRLLTGIELNDKKPSELLREMVPVK